MNTDNMSMLGLTLDYGPYGWLEPYDPGWTPNTTDRETSRYRFGNQPNIAFWNLARLAEALYPLIGNEERVYLSLSIYKDTFEKSYSQILSQKFGFPPQGDAEDSEIIETLFELLQAVETDYTLFFRGLSDWKVSGDVSGEKVEKLFQELIVTAFYNPDDPVPELRTKWIHWLQRYSKRVKSEEISDDQRSLNMKKVNPKYVLRNYLAQNAISAAEKGDLSVMERLMRVLETPYDELLGEEDLASKRPEWARHAPGCSALSCSS